MKAFYKDRNIFVSNADGSGEIALTTDGSVQERTKYGVGSWVYGEELGQTSAIWWSPDGSKVAFYYFNEGKVKDYYLQMMQTDLQSALDVEAYPRPALTTRSPTSSSTTWPRKSARRSMSATASRSRTTSSATTCTPSSGRPTAPS
jgi:hypothetical protein